MDDTRKVKVLKDDGPPPPPPPDAPPSLFQRFKPLVYLSGAGCLFLVAFVFMFAITWLVAPKPKPVVPGGKIAILPVAAQSEGAEHLAAAFGVSLAEGLKSRPEFEVLPLTKTEKYASDTRKLEEIGDELQVRWLVSSALTTDTEQVRFKVDLILLDEDARGSALSDTFSRSRVVPWSAVDGAANAIARAAFIEMSEREGEAKKEVKITVSRARADEAAWERYLAGEWGCTREPLVPEGANEAARKAATAKARAEGMAAYAAAYTADPTWKEARVGQAKCAQRAASEGHVAEADAKKEVASILQAWLATDANAKADPAFVELAGYAGMKL